MSNPKEASETEESVPLRKADVVFKRHPRARRYLAKVDREGRILLTLPKSGTQRDALAFANSHRVWLEEQRIKALETLSQKPATGLKSGDSIWYRGEKTEVTVDKDFGRPVVSFADQRIFIADADMNLSVPIEKRLRGIAKAEFEDRVRVLAAENGFEVKRVTIRDQRTRWGSCSTSGTISLSWRLILAPEAASDYVILHELAHLRHFNHSPSFWKTVEALCPDYRTQELWLKKQQDELARVCK